MLDGNSAYIPNDARTHLVATDDITAQRCDVFRVEYRTSDGLFHENISTLTVRCLAHKIQSKHLVIIGVYETQDEKVRAFIDAYKDQVLVVTKRHFDFDTGKTTKKTDYRCMFESGRLPHMCDLPDKPAMFELVFREI